MTTTHDSGTYRPPAPGRPDIRQRTLRTDRWWLPPLVTALGLPPSSSTRRSGRSGTAYYVAEYHYLSPFYSPCVCADAACPAASALRPVLRRLVVPLTGALVLLFLLGFRLTCYYYRKAYYRSFWSSPPACAVAEPHKKYTGETRFPLILQNIHRYFFYAAVLVAADQHLRRGPARSATADGGLRHRASATSILLVNVVLLWAYTLSCHSCRHIVGGRLKHFSKHPVRYRLWTCVSKLNARHMQLAWVSLVTRGARPTSTCMAGRRRLRFDDLRVLLRR